MFLNCDELVIKFAYKMPKISLLDQADPDHNFMLKI
jgi:hypothetical protein